MQDMGDIGLGGQTFIPAHAQGHPQGHVVDSEQGDYCESDDEGEEGYRIGGYCRVALGETFVDRYAVAAKLGWGHFSTVWLCKDAQKGNYVAMKVQKSAAHYTQAAGDEIDLLQTASRKVVDYRKQRAEELSVLKGIVNLPDSSFTGVVKLTHYFDHHGPHGKHVCMVFEALGPNALALIKKYDFKGVPLELVRRIALHTLIGLDYLHRVCKIIHTDLKPENVLVTCPKGIPVNKNGQPLITQGQVFAREDELELPPPESSNANNSKHPPYVRPGLKPSRSDPTLLNS